MRTLISRIVILIALVLVGFSSMGQTSTATSNHTLTMGIPEVCLIGTSAAAISLQLTTTTAGNQISGGTGTGYAQVSSIVSASETRTITASVTQFNKTLSLILGASRDPSSINSPKEVAKK